MNKTNDVKIKFLFWLAFVLPFLFWLYLASTSQMVIVHDAAGFQQLSDLLLQKGWIGYLSTGPHREPLFPLLLVVAKVIGKIFEVSRESIQLILQGILFFFSQWLLFCLLRRLRIHPLIIATTVLYFGFSPSLLNTALSSFSEIAAVPCVLGIILINCYALESLRQANRKKILWTAGALGIIFFLTAMVKVTYAQLADIFLLPYALAAVWAIVRRQRILGKNLITVVIVACLSAQGPLVFYKWLNKKYNGTYALTDRGSQVLYHSAALRADTLTPQRWRSAFAAIPGVDFCVSRLGQTTCDFWTTKNLESYGEAPALVQKLQALPVTERSGFFLQEAKKKFFQRPFQFVFLLGLDALKLFFWESTHIGFVLYPGWLTSLYDNAFVVDSFRFLLGTFSLTAFFFVVFFLFRQRKEILNWTPGKGIPGLELFFMVWLMGFHIGAYAFCSATVPRHATAIAPLYLAAIAFLAHRLFFHEKQA